MTFQDFAGPGKHSAAGFGKIAAFCKLLVQHSKKRILDAGEVSWCWVDTACIDKRSSAELSEAVNSMAEWYANAEFCIAYLEDVSSRGGTCSTLFTKRGRPSNWFSRGWTLQELLFPNKLLFCDKSWNIIPGLDKGSFEGSARISAVTGIPAECLQDPRNISQHCIASRMSWAAERVTTRVEDEAYCLLGLFEINMPLLYGEGNRAFFRLQKEIIDSYEDETIFAWLDMDPMLVDGDDTRPIAMPILAPHPSWFIYKTRQSTHRTSLEIREPYKLTNRGLELEACAVVFKPYRDDASSSHVFLEDELIVVQLNCSATFAGMRNGTLQDPSVSQGWLICLRKVATKHETPTYARVLCWATGVVLYKHLQRRMREAPDVRASKRPRQKYYIAASTEQMRSIVPRQSFAAVALPNELTMQGRAQKERTDGKVYTLDELYQSSLVQQHPGVASEQYLALGGEEACSADTFLDVFDICMLQKDGLIEVETGGNG